MKKLITNIIVSTLTVTAFANDFDFHCSEQGHFIQPDISTHASDSGLFDYDVKYYAISLDMSNVSAYIRGYADIMAQAVEPIDTLALELSSDLLLDSLFLNGTRVNSYDHENDLIHFLPPDPLEKKNAFTIRIHYQGMSGQEGFYAGISNRLDAQWNTRVTYTLSEPFRALDWFPCKQVLTDKADSSDVYITVDEGLMAGSNGILAGIDSLPGRKLRYHWKSRYPIAYYLISAAVARYIDYSFYTPLPSPGDSLLVQNFIYDAPGYLEQYRDDIDATGALLNLYSELISPYPFPDEKYGHCLAPMGGGMEHQTMTSLSGFNFTLVAHELMHQWFGDQVTCATWQDIWINEGFASYGEYLALEKLKSAAEADLWMQQAHEWALSEPDGSVYIPKDEASEAGRIFSRALSYKKGACLLHMIRHELKSDTLFYSVLSNFQRIYADSTATGADFLNVLNQVSGRDFSWFFDQWYYGKGFPRFKVVWWQENDSLNLDVRQTGSSSSTTFFRTRLDIRLQYENGKDTLIEIDFDGNPLMHSRVMKDQVVRVEVDPENWVLEQSEIIRKTDDNAYFSVSPNPFADELKIVFYGGLEQREILLSDLSGKILRKKSTSSESVVLKTENLNQGLYLLKVREGKDNYSTKVIRQ
jgi:aminopeptidase N